jgi:hypothetical protein
VQRIVRAYEDNKQRVSEAQMSLSLNSSSLASRAVPPPADRDAMLADPVQRIPGSEEAAEI